MGPSETLATDKRAEGEARRAEVEARLSALRASIARLERSREVGPRARYRMLLWSVALAALFAGLRPGSVHAAGPEARLLRGVACAGGHRLSSPGEAARVGPGDVLVAGPDGLLELRVGPARLSVQPGARVLVERLGPPSLRLLRGAATVAGPLGLLTLAGRLEVPAGVTVEVREGAGTGPAAPLQALADAPGATWTDALGRRPVPVRGR